jgi:lipoyl(octanoyl) transferase
MPENGERSASLAVRFEGEIPYREALVLQRHVHAARCAGACPDTLLLLTHPSVITLGRATDIRNLLLSPEEYARLGIEVVETDRGGDVTWHGPGQLVGYPVVDLRSRGLGPRTFLRCLEDSLIDLLAGYGVAGRRVPGLTGVFVGEEKIAALGIRVARGVSLHGFALNVRTGPAAFAGIVPCGIRDHGVTSLDRRLSPCPSVDAVARRYPRCLEVALG